MTVTISDIIVCPSCRSDLRAGASEFFCTSDACRYSSKPFPIVAGQPVLIDFERSIFDRASYCEDKNESVIPRDLSGRSLKTRIKSLVFGRNEVTAVSL